MLCLDIRKAECSPETKWKWVHSMGLRYGPIKHKELEIPKLPSFFDVEKKSDRGVTRRLSRSEVTFVALQHVLQSLVRNGLSLSCEKLKLRGSPRISTYQGTVETSSRQRVYIW